MTSERDQALWRLEHIREAAARIRILLTNKVPDDLQSDFVVRSAYERLIEIISEASRHIPTEWQAEHPDVPWRRVQDIGNVLRHVYHKIEPSVLWNIYAEQLADLERAIDAMIERYGPIP